MIFYFLILLILFFWNYILDFIFYIFSLKNRKKEKNRKSFFRKLQQRFCIFHNTRTSINNLNSCFLCFFNCWKMFSSWLKPKVWNLLRIIIIWKWVFFFFFEKKKQKRIPTFAWIASLIIVSVTCGGVMIEIAVCSGWGRLEIDFIHGIPRISFSVGLIGVTGFWCWTYQSRTLYPNYVYLFIFFLKQIH